MLVQGHGLETILVLTSLVNSCVLRSCAAFEEDKRNTDPLLLAALNASLADGATTLLSEPTIYDARPGNASTTWSDRQNSSSSSSVGFHNPKYVCDGAAYGRNINAQSCLDAMTSLRGHDYPRTFGRREKGKFDVNLPFRFLGSEFFPSRC